MLVYKAPVPLRRVLKEEAMKKEISLDLEGMSCAACANRIEKALAGLNGVQEAAVNFALDKATVKYDPGLLTPLQMAEKIKAIGYDVRPKKAEFGLSGKALDNDLGGALEKIPGVLKTSLDYASGKAVIEYLSADSLLAEIKRVIAGEGYKFAQVNALTAEELRKQERRKEINRLKTLVVFSAVLSLPLFLCMIVMLLRVSEVFPSVLFNPYFQFALATPVQFIAGGRFYKESFLALRNKSVNMSVLVVLGTSAAYFYSAAVVFFHFAGGHEVYFETGSIIITLVLLGKTLETSAKGRTSEAIEKLLKLQVKTARVIRDDQEVEVPLEEVQAGDLILVRSGERLPVDGIIREGYSTIDESMLTGESVPVDKHEGSEVFGATVNRLGSFKFEATRVGQDTMLARIIQIVQDAQSSKAPSQRLADILAGYFVPGVIILAVLAFSWWYFFGDPGNFTRALLSFTAVLVIACPCALGLATPTSIVVGAGRGAANGILFKSGEYLEKVNSLTAMVFDKTGTITEGKLKLTGIMKAPEYNGKEEGLLAFAGGAEQFSEHPLARAIVEYVNEKGITAGRARDFESIPGYGVKAVINDQKVLLGTRRLMSKEGVDLASLLPAAGDLEANGETVVFLALDGRPAALFSMADVLKKSSGWTVERLREMGLEVWMITGDNASTALAVAGKVGIGNVLYEVLPQDKARKIEQLKQEGKVVGMVGDGINDAPALAAADVGFAVGTGTDIAIEAAGVTLLKGDLRDVVTGILLSRATVRNIKQNLFWALIYNTVGIPVAAAGLLNPIIAGAAMAFSSVSVVTNALRLKRIRLETNK